MTAPGRADVPREGAQLTITGAAHQMYVDGVHRAAFDPEALFAALEAGGCVWPAKGEVVVRLRREVAQHFHDVLALGDRPGGDNGDCERCALVVDALRAALSGGVS